ncbi:MAG: hypothetical protein OEX00_11730, partial [Gammaproteobacteria bacterium]|nr:hypothetical protein [Gammaproteobacteria bacterium]
MKLESNKEVLWVIGRKQIAAVNQNGERIAHQHFDSHVYDLVKTNGFLFVAFHKEIRVFDHSLNYVRTIKDKRMGFIRGLGFDAERHLIRVASYRGLFSIDLNNADAVMRLTRKRAVRNLTLDLDGNIWFWSFSKLFYYDAHSNNISNIRVFSRKKNHSHKHIRGLALNLKTGQAWVATSHKIALVDFNGTVHDEIQLE